MKVSIIIPCYNEESTIKEIIRKINFQKDIEKEIIIIDDYSTDQTRTILKKSIRKILTNKDVMEKMGLAARKKILSEHSPDRIGNIFSNYLNKISD